MIKEAKIENRLYTPEEYFHILEESDLRIEYYKGKIFAMAGGQPDHNKIATNITRALGNALEDKCVTFNSDQAIHIEQADTYVFPDASVVCEKEEYHKNNFLKNPTIIVEVLSPSTEKGDKIDKLAYYQSLPSLQEYIIISTDKPLIFNYSRHTKHPKNTFLLNVTMGIKSVLEIPTFDLAIPLEKIYKNTQNVQEV